MRNREQARKYMEEQQAKTAMLREILSGKTVNAKRKAITLRNPLFYKMFPSGIKVYEDADGE